MEARNALLRDGAAIYKNALPAELLEPLREFTRKEVESFTLKPGQKDADAAPVYPDVPLYNQVIQRGAALLTELGFRDVRWLSAALIPKWQGEGRRGWHIDWWGWEGTADTYREDPPQIGILFYIDDAHMDTGALLVAPGSHRRQVPDHFNVWESWEPYAKELALSADAGDAVLLDPRALHAVTGNTRLPIRNCLTMWYLIDFAKLSKGTRATAMLSGAASDGFKNALGPLNPDFNDGDFRDFYFPHCKKPQFPITNERIDALRGGRSDRAVVGSAARPEDGFLDEHSTYSWYFGIGAAKAPGRIVEFGVKFGYSLIAMAKGAQWAGMEPSLQGIDAEADGFECIETALLNIHNETNLPTIIHKENTLTMNPDVLKPTADIIHIDADHSQEGIARELYLAEMFIKPNGLILVDDVDIGYIHEAAVGLAFRCGIDPIFLPTQHGLMLIDMSKRTRYEIQSRDSHGAECATDR